MHGEFNYVRVKVKMMMRSPTEIFPNRGFNWGLNTFHAQVQAIALYKCNAGPGRPYAALIPRLRPRSLG